MTYPAPDRRHTPVVVDDELVGRVEVRTDPYKSSVRLLEIGGHLHGAIDLERPERLELDYLARMYAVLDALLPAGPAHVLHLGGGAFALPRALANRRPEVSQTVVELSQVIIRLAERELGLRGTDALTIVHDDARATLQRCDDGSVDAVVGDAFIGGKVPPHLATVEFAADVARVLRPRGFYLVNLIDAPDWPVLSTHAAALRSALPHLLAVAAPAIAQLRAYGNMLLIASRRPLHRPTLEWRMRDGVHPTAVVASGRLAALAARARPRHDADG
jgi:spermidine synthase